MNDAVDEWLDTVSGNDRVWFAKRLSANDSGATASHQAGIYIPKPVLWTIFPSMKIGSNPDAWFSAEVMPYGESRSLRAIWYNEKSRNESRITQWNRPNRILEPDQTGALILFAFQKRTSEEDAEHVSAWICQSETEEEIIENRVGAVEPGEGTLHYPAGFIDDKSSLIQPIMRKDCTLAESDIPDAWVANFPSGQELIEHALSLMPKTGTGPDARLLSRRECETALFYSVERSFVLPKIIKGFSSVDAFVDLANSVTNRRKSRAGRSFELHLKGIFQEEALSFSHGEVSEGNKKPDFLFPSIEAYRDAAWPENKLRMLAAKTTCKDRWRQILNEANRIAHKHLVTLQQGVSENQFREMGEAGVVLVVPKRLHSSYPEVVRPNLQSLEQFIQETKSISEA